MRTILKYIAAILFCCILLVKGVGPVVWAKLNNNSVTELMADIETGESKKNIPQPSETEFYFPFDHFISTYDCCQSAPVKLLVEQSASCTQNIFISIPTPPPEI